ncbi:TetR/AcrR family transcriptional regulator [Corynebacterium epidermidicanis]|nr:TetR/AcrR family transcriptional regulator [Corynebacterium epidermidicanis]
MSAEIPRRTRLTPTARKQAILTTAAEHFASLPFTDVSVSAIATDLGVSVALVHKYFQSKNGLFAAVLSTWLADVAVVQQRELDEVVSTAPKQDRVTAWVRGYLLGLAALPSDKARRQVLHGHDDADATAVRARAAERNAQKLSEIVAPNVSERDRYALLAGVGAMTAVAAQWAEKGCPEQQIWPAISAVVGAIHGSLGDWQR